MSCIIVFSFCCNNLNFLETLPVYKSSYHIKNKCGKKNSLIIEDYILKIKSIAHSLVAVGHQISDDELVLYILGDLGPEYESVVVNLTALDSVTIPELQYMLQTHEMRLENFNSIALVDVSAAAVHVAQKKPASGSSSQFPQSSSHGFSNSFRGRNSRSRFGPRGVRQNSSPLLCQICGKSGHSAMKWFHRFDLSFSGAASSSYSTDFIPSPSSAQVNLACPSTVTDKAWYMDSVATHHVTSQDNAMSAKTGVYWFKQVSCW